MVQRMSGTALAPIRLSSVFVQAALLHADAIRPLARIASPVLNNALRRAGVPAELTALCSGLLASVVDDLVAISGLPKTDYSRTKRKQRVLEAAEEPASYALRIAIAAAPLNGKAAVAHWDAICEPHERGKLAWLLGMDTELAWTYGKRMERQNATGIR